MIATLAAKRATNEKISFTLKDQAGSPPTLLTLTLTLYDVATGGVINSRSAQSILGTNGGTYDTGTGLVTLTLTAPLDMPIVTASNTEELHRAIFKATWTGGEFTDYADIWVENTASAAVAETVLQDNALLTLAELKRALGGNPGGLTGPERNRELTVLINACSDEFEMQTGRRIVTRAYTSEYVYVKDAQVHGTKWLDVEWPITALTLLEIDGTAQTIWMPGDAGNPKDFQVFVLAGSDPKTGRDGIYRPGGWTCGALVKRTYTAGYGATTPAGMPPVPANLKEMVVSLARDWFHASSRQSEPVVSRSTAGETVTYVREALPLRFRSLVNDYRRWGF